jgi:hypothetical protein
VTAPPRLERARLAGADLALLQPGGWRRAAIRLVELDGHRLVVKDFGGCARWLRATLGRRLVARELRAYHALAGHPNVPRLLAVVDDYAFALEHRPGRHLSRRVRPSLPPDFLARLEEAIAAMHRRGVVHLDLRHRDNVLVDEAGAPVLLDFASAVCLPGRAGRALLAPLAWIDRRALAKWRARLQGAPDAGVGSDGESEGRRGASRPT